MSKGKQTSEQKAWKKAEEKADKLPKNLASDITKSNSNYYAKKCANALKPIKGLDPVTDNQVKICGTIVDTYKEASQKSKDTIKLSSKEKELIQKYVDIIEVKAKITPMPTPDVTPENSFTPENSNSEHSSSYRYSPMSISPADDRAASALEARPAPVKKAPTTFPQKTKSPQEKTSFVDKYIAESRSSGSESITQSYTPAGTSGSLSPASSQGR